MSYRTVGEDVWDDEWVAEQPTAGKAFWLWLITNRATEISGIYRYNRAVAAAQLGLATEELVELEAAAQAAGKAEFGTAGWVWVTNYSRRQPSGSAKVWVGMVRQLDGVPVALLKGWLRRYAGRVREVGQAAHGDAAAELLEWLAKHEAQPLDDGGVDGRDRVSVGSAYHADEREVRKGRTAVPSVATEGVGTGEGADAMPDGLRLFLAERGTTDDVRRHAARMREKLGEALGAEAVRRALAQAAKQLAGGYAPRNPAGWLTKLMEDRGRDVRFEARRARDWERGPPVQA